MLAFRYIVAAFNLLVAIIFAIMAVVCVKDKSAPAFCGAIAVYAMVNMVAVMFGG